MRAARPTFAASPLRVSPRSALLPSQQALRITPAARTYSTAPNSHQVLQSFGTPFAQFIHTISRIARIITFTALGAATIGVISFEAAHQYVEHIAMPAASSSSSSTDDEFGWNQLALEESWSGSPRHTGTDPRLGIKGRHAVRSAWMCVHWGGGISPSVFFGGNTGNSGLGRTAITSMAGAKTLKVDDGMIMAMQYLNLAVKIAAAKGIKLPDTDAIRAGLISESAAQEQLGHIDPLALALEARLAAVKERQGSRGALESAIASYEKLYDIASLTGAGVGGADPTRLVRLATKLADLHAALDQRGPAEEWLSRAVGIAATAGAHTPDVNVATAEVEKAERKGRLLGGWFSSSSSAKASPPVAEPAPAMTATAAPTPALTRSLITALVSKSAFHAHTPTPSSLQQALHTQMSALQLAAAEQQRLPPAASLDAELHTLWLLHHQSILELHVAETIYALSRHAKTSKLSLPAWFTSGTATEKARPQSIEWVDQADTRAKQVVTALEKAAKIGKVGKGQREELAVEVGERWEGQKAVKVAATRVLRDAKRVQSAAERCRSALQAM